MYEYFIKIFIRFIKRNFLKDLHWSRVQLEPFLQGQSFDVLFHTRVLQSCAFLLEFFRSIEFSQRKKLVMQWRQIDEIERSR